MFKPLLVHQFYLPDMMTSYGKNTLNPHVNITSEARGNLIHVSKHMV